MPPMHEKLPTRRGEATQWMSKGAFEQSVLGSSDRQIRVDISRLIITLLALNFLSAVALWHYDTIRDWLQLHQKDLNTTVVWLSRAITILIVGGVSIAGVAVCGQARRASGKGASPGHSTTSPKASIGSESAFDWGSARAVTEESNSQPTSAPKLADQWEYIDPTPTPVRRANSRQAIEPPGRRGWQPFDVLRSLSRKKGGGISFESRPPMVWQVSPSDDSTDLRNGNQAAAKGLGTRALAQ